MKVLRTEKDGVYHAMVSGYCCDSMFQVRGLFSFYSNGKYCLENDVSNVIEQVRFCPFCGEKIEIAVLNAKENEV